MRHCSLRMFPCFTSAWLALAAGCVLDPESVGDQSTGQATDSPSTDDAGETAGADTIEDPTTLGDDASADGVSATSSGDTSPEEEWYELWPDVVFHDVTRYDDGRWLVLATDDDSDGSVIRYHDAEGAGVGTASWARRFETFAVGPDDQIVAGGGQQPGDDPLESDACLWLLGEDGVIEHEVVLAGGSSWVHEIAVGGDALWTLTEERPGPDDPLVGVLRRHGPEGVVELTHPLLASASTLAVDQDGYAYSVTRGAAPQLHRIAPEGGVVWSLPMEAHASDAVVLHARQGAPGVVIVSTEEDEWSVRELDGDGVTLHDFTMPAASDDPPVSHVGDALFLAYRVPPKTYMVEAWSLDGTQLWSAERYFPSDTMNVVLHGVIDVPGMVSVIGVAVRLGVGYGFVRSVLDP